MTSKLRPNSIRNSLVLGLIGIALTGTGLPAAAESLLVGQCGAECSREFCLPNDFTPGGLQQCFRDCHQDCVRSLRTEVLRPKYYILSLIYAPPGCTSTERYRCPDLGSVSYLSGSSTGTTTSTTRSFRSGNTVSVERGLSFEGISLFGLTSEDNFTTSVTSGDSLTLAKTQSFELKTSGNGDGIDHGQDMFLLLLNPAVAVESLRSRSNWNFGYSGPSALLYKVYVSWLKDGQRAMPAQVKDVLINQHHFTPEDFQAILAQDPFAGGTAAIDPARFARTRWTLPYEPAPRSESCSGGVCACATLSPTITDSIQHETFGQVETQYTTALTVRANLLSLTDQESFTFTTTTSRRSTAGSTNSAATTIACPSPDYTGPTLIAVYWDKLFSSFMFAPHSENAGPVHEGVVTDALGAPVINEEVALSAGGDIYYTLTDRAGRFRFPLDQATSAAAQIMVGGMKQPVSLDPSARTRIQINTPD